MLLMLVILLTLLEISLMITLTGIKASDLITRGIASVSTTVAEKGISSIDNQVTNKINKSNKWYIKGTHKINRYLLKLSGTTLETVAKTGYKVLMQAVKTGLKVAILVVGMIRNLLFAAMIQVLLIDIIIFIIILAVVSCYILLGV